MRTTRLLVLPIVLAAFAGSVACSSDGGGGTDDVATLDSDGSSDTEDTASDDEGGGQGGRGMSQEFQDALLDFAECMRDHGVDMPDPEFDGDGGVSISMGAAGGPGAGPPSAADQAEMEAAQEECQPIMDAVESEMPRPDPEQQQEMQDQALAFAECMREHGIDMPDPEFGENGMITQAIGGPDGPGFDPSDDDFQAAQDACTEDGEGGPGIVVGGAGPAGGSFSTSSDSGRDTEGEDG